MRSDVGVQVQESKETVLKHKKQINVKCATVKIVANNRKEYNACVVQRARDFRIINVTENLEKRAAFKVRLRKRRADILCTLNARIESIAGLRGAEVSIRKIDEDTIIKGKIVSVHPYIIGTPPGGSPLPPIDE